MTYVGEAILNTGRRFRVVRVTGPTRQACQDALFTEHPDAESVWTWSDNAPYVGRDRINWESTRAFGNITEET